MFCITISSSGEMGGCLLDWPQFQWSDFNLCDNSQDTNKHAQAATNQLSLFWFTSKPCRVTLL